MGEGLLKGWGYSKKGGDAYPDLSTTQDSTADNAQPTQDDPGKEEDMSDFSNSVEIDAAARDTVRHSADGTVQQRVETLFAGTDLCSSDETDYGALYDGAVYWPNEKVLIRFDELAYIFLQVMRAKTGKAKTCYYRDATVLKLGAEQVEMRLDIDFVLTNKLLAFLYGKGSQRLSIVFAISVVDGVLALDNLCIEGDKRLNDKLISLGSDVLFGTTDYKGYVDNLLRTSSGHIGRVINLSSSGVLFSCGQAS